MKHQHIDWALFLQNLAAHRCCGQGPERRKSNLKHVTLYCAFICQRIASLNVCYVRYCSPILFFNVSWSNIITGLPWMAGEISKMWIINEVLIDQIPALHRLYSCALDINTLSWQNQCIQLYETNTGTEHFHCIDPTHLSGEFRKIPCLSGVKVISVYSVVGM